MKGRFGKSIFLKLPNLFARNTVLSWQKNDLSQYVSGKVEPRQEKLTILGLALNVSETWLMGYDVRRERDEKEQLAVPSELSDVKARLIQYVYPLTDEQAALALRVLKSILEDAE